MTAKSPASPGSHSPSPGLTALTVEDVKAIKRRLWMGETRLEVATDLGISLGLVCNIGSGHRWQRVPWPDGSTHAMSQQRLDTIQAARDKAQTGILREVQKILSRPRRRKKT